MFTRRRLIVGTIVFVFAGLLLYTFANPSQVNESTGNDPIEQEQAQNNTQIEEQEKEENTSNVEENNITPVRPNGPTAEEIANRANRIAYLLSLTDKNKEDYTSTSFRPYEELVNEISQINVNNLTNNQIENYITRLEEAIENLVELKLTELSITPNNDVYKRLEAQKELTFRAIYNDITRNEQVDATTEDLFNSNTTTDTARTMTYSYLNKYGKVSSNYNYTVVKNDKDLLLDKLEELRNTEINEEDYTTDSVNDLKELLNTDETNLDEEELENLIEKIENAIENLVELELTGLTVSSNNDVYKRLDNQKELTFKAIYNDTTRNKDVTATTEDLFNSNTITDTARTMTYTYSDKYGSEDVVYSYTVVKNERDLLLDKLEELRNTEINEEDYTTDSVNDLKKLLNTDETNLDEEELENLIEEIENAIENLVELELTGLTVSSNNDVYKRLDNQKELTFKAIYNDTLRNKDVIATTEDSFNSNTTTDSARTMTYTYSDKYGSEDVVYSYTVVRNDNDKEIKGIYAELSQTDFDYKSQVNINDYLTVRYVANDGVKSEPITAYEVEGFTTDTLTTNGKLTVSATEYELDSVELDYTVSRTEAGKQLESLTVTLNKNQYNWKDTYYTSKVMAKDVDGIEYEVTREAVVIKGFDTATVGEKEYKVSYTKGNVTKEATFNYTVNRTYYGMVLDHIEATISNSQIERLSSFEKIMPRLTVTAVDVDGTRYVVNDYWLNSNFNTETITQPNETRKFVIAYCKGTYYCTSSIKYDEVEYTVVKNENDLKVTDVIVTLDKTNYSINEELGELTVKAKYGYGNVETVDASTCTTDFDNTTVGYETTLNVTCGELKGTTKYSVYDNDLRKITATLNKADGKYSTNDEINVTVKYTDEYNRTNTLSNNEYSITKDNKPFTLTTQKEGTYNIKVTYNKSGEAYTKDLTYVVNEKYLFDIKIVDDKLIQLTESYTDFIDITEIKVTYKGTYSNHVQTFKASKGEIEMIGSESSYQEGDITVYVKPTYETDEFEKDRYNNYRTPIQIEIFYGKTKEANTKYHAHKVTYTVNDNGDIIFKNHEDLNKNYNKK